MVVASNSQAVFFLMNRSANTVLLVWGLLSSPPYCEGQCPCAPDYCLGDSRIARRLEEKKQALRKLSFPEELIAILDRQSGWYAAVDRVRMAFQF